MNTIDIKLCKETIRLYKAIQEALAQSERIRNMIDKISNDDFCCGFEGRNTEVLKGAAMLFGSISGAYDLMCEDIKMIISRENQIAREAEGETHDDQ